MESKTRQDTRFKATGFLVLMIILVSVYLFIALSTMENHTTCMPRMLQTDAYQLEQKFKVGVTYNSNEGKKGLGSSATNGQKHWEQAGQGVKVGRPKVSEKCTPTEIRRRAGAVVLTTTNAAYLDFTNNWLASIQRTRACPNITVVAEDSQSFRDLSRKHVTGLHVLQTHSGMASSNKLVFNTKEYRRFVNKRQGYILGLLEQGWEVLFSDVDTFWFRDPFPYLQGNHDMAFEEDIPGPRRLLCAGFVHFRPTERTLRFVREWIRFMENDKTLKPDQIVMNIMIRNRKIPGLKIRILNSDQFPNGQLFFNETWRRDKGEIVVVHNNFIVGHDIKVERFKNHNMWLVDE